MKIATLLTLILTCIYAGNSLAQAQKPPAVSLTVTIEDMTSDLATPTQVHSDGLGVYTDGVSGVTAELGTAGNINIQFWPGRGTPQRNVKFNHDAIPGQPYSGPYQLFLGGQIPPAGFGTNPHLYSQPPSPALSTPYVAIQNMPVGSAQCVLFYWAFGYRDLFHFGLANTSNTPTAFVVVRRDSSSQWTVEAPLQGSVPTGCPAADPVSLVVHDVATGKNQTTTVEDGYFYLPFRLTLRVK